MSAKIIIPSRRPPGFWQKLHNQRKFFENLGKHLKIKSWEDWYTVPHEEVLKFGGHGICL